MNRTERRRERIREVVPLRALLNEFGYGVHPTGDQEEQFCCDLHGDGNDTKPSARIYANNTTYCVSQDSPILTPTGWVRLVDVKQGVPVLNGLGEWKCPEEYQDKGIKEGFLLTTSAGYSVVATFDHKVETQNRGWVPAGEISTEDSLVIVRPKTPTFNPSIRLPIENQISVWNARKYQGKQNLSLPLNWSMGLGEVLGYVFGDGWLVIREKNSFVGITSHVKDAEDARKVFQQMQEWAPGRGSERPRTDSHYSWGRIRKKNQVLFTLGNDDFCQFLVALGLDKSSPIRQRRVPKSLWSAPECAIRGFLRGIFATDGTIFKATETQYLTINLYSVSVQFLLDVQLMLLQFGIFSRVYQPSRTVLEGKPTHPAAYLQIATYEDKVIFRSKVGFANARKQLILDTLQPPLKKPKPFRARVRSCNPVGLVPVADLAMPVEHSFSAGGIKVHNCWACSVARDAIAYVRAKKDLEYIPALDWLEAKYHLLPLPFEPEDQVEKENLYPDPIERDATFEGVVARVRRQLDRMTLEKVLPLDTLLKFWEDFDRTVYLVGEKLLDERKGMRDLLILREQAAKG